MRLCEKIEIAAPIERIWRHVSTPELWPGFVSKIQVVERLEDDFLRIVIGGKEVIGKVELAKKTSRFRFAGQLTNQSADSSLPFAIEYLLTPNADKIEVSEIQEFELPFLIGLLVRFFHRFGKPQQQTNLQELKELCENPNR